MDAEDRLLWERAFDKFDAMDEKITKLCITTAETKAKVDGHIQEQEKKGVRKERVFYLVIAAIASIFSLFSFLREQI